MTTRLFLWVIKTQKVGSLQAMNGLLSLFNSINKPSSSMKHVFFVSLLLIGSATCALASSVADSTRTKSPASTGIQTHAHYEGIISLATDGQYGFFCLGGPSVGLTQGHWRVAIHLYPSLRLGRPEGSPSPGITPTLGTGIYVAYKRAIFLVPFHYISEERRWTVAVGLGWKVTK